MSKPVAPLLGPLSGPRNSRLARGVVFLSALLLLAPASARIVSQQRAQDAGLTRAWFTQAPLDPATQHIVGARLFDGSIYVLTSGGLLQALDAETGVTRWQSRIGDASTPAYGPSIYDTSKVDEDGNRTELTKVGVVTGSIVHVVRADTGAEIMRHRSGGPPATAPAMTGTHAFVPLMGGRLMGHPFDQLKGLPIVVSSPGTLMAEPVVSDDRIVWSTAEGRLYGADPETGVPAYQFTATAELSGTPRIVDKSMYFATKTGVVFAMTVDRARPLWKASIGVTVKKPVVVLGGVVYVAAESPTLYAFDAADGAERWRVEGLSSFVSASEKHLYAINPNGALGVLDRTTGEPVDSWPADGRLRPIVNTETDRLYFLSDAGVIQCFHEEGLAEPFFHGGKPADAASEAPAGETPAPATAEPEARVEDAPAPSLDDTPAEDDPFGSFEEDAPDDDPFGAEDFPGF